MPSDDDEKFLTVLAGFRDLEVFHLWHMLLEVFETDDPATKARELNDLFRPSLESRVNRTGDTFIKTLEQCRANNTKLAALDSYDRKKIDAMVYATILDTIPGIVAHDLTERAEKGQGSREYRNPRTLPRP